MISVIEPRSLPIYKLQGCYNHADTPQGCSTLVVTSLQPVGPDTNLEPMWHFQVEGCHNFGCIQSIRKLCGCMPHTHIYLVTT